MKDFEAEVLQRLTVIETKLGPNGLATRVEDLEEWVKANPDVPVRLSNIEDWAKSHPVVCPLENRRRDFLHVLAIIVGTAATIKGLDVVIGWLT